jgi:hypothetical protein
MMTKKVKEAAVGEGLDVDRLRLGTSSLPTSTARSAQSIPGHQRGERFLKGPIPWTWLQLAARQPGKALHVALVLWQLVGMKRSVCVTLNLSRLAALGVSRYAASRGLKALRAARLVSFEAQTGRKARVTVLDLSVDADRGRDGG